MEVLENYEEFIGTTYGIRTYELGTEDTTDLQDSELDIEIFDSFLSVFFELDSASKKLLGK